MRNVVIIGGMAAGCRAAARLSRLCPDYTITVIEKSSFISFSSCGLPLYAAGEVNDLSDLYKTSYGVVRDTDFFREVKGIKVLLKTEVTEIDADNKKVNCNNIEKGEQFELPYDYLILATGSEATEPKFAYPSSPLVSSFHSPRDSIYFRKAAQKGEIEKAVIIGGGFIGCEMTEALSSLWGIETILIEKEKHLLSSFLDPEMSLLAERGIPKDKIRLLLSTEVKKIELNEKSRPVVITEIGGKITSDYVFYCLGVRPNSKLAKSSGIVTGANGGIIVDGQMRTNIPGIWAAGDCTEIKNLVTGKSGYFSFGSLSNRMGRAAADSIASVSSGGSNEGFKGAAGTFSLKLFDTVICAAGLTEAAARRHGYNAASVIGCWYDRPDYHPESKNIFGKLVYERNGLKLLGIQLIGQGEVTRYIDVFSVLLSQSKSVEDLLELEHGYTPAHSSPVSPLNYLGYMAINRERDGIINIDPSELSSFNGIIIDVRETPEIETHGTFPVPAGFSGQPLNIPLTELRSRIKELDSGQPLLFVCERGTRAYEAARISGNYGCKNVSYLGGGILMYGGTAKFSEIAEMKNGR